jgi:signal transduction histidine kinase
MGQSTAERILAKPPVPETDGNRTPSAEVVLQRLAACLGHHVNNALTGAIAYLELSLRDGSGKSQLHSHLHAGLACAHRAAETVKRLVAFASPRKPADERAPVSLRQLAEEAARKVLERHASELRVTVTGEAIGLALGSASLLRTALEQVVRNAVEAMPREGTLMFRVDRKAGRVRLSVCDSGPGLSAEAAAHLFDPFWTSKTNGHLGLGLVMSRDMLQAQGGTLTVDSAPAGGTTVTLSLPAARAEEPGQAASAAEQPDPAVVHAPSSGALLPTRC